MSSCIPCNISCYEIFDINIAIPTFLWFMFAWYIFFHPFIFNLFVPLYIKWVSYRQHFWKIQSDNLWLVTGAFDNLRFNRIINMIEFKSIVLLFLFICVISLFYFPFFPFLVEYFLWFHFISTIGLLVILLFFLF